MTLLATPVPQSPPPAAPAQPLRVAYLMSRFPKITETFILREMCEMERLGVNVDVYPLQRERTKVMHPEAAAFVERANFTPLMSPGLGAANLKQLQRSPGQYMGTLSTLFRANWGSPRYLGGAMAFFPKAVAWARQMKRNDVDHIHAHFASHPAAMAYAIHQLTDIPFSFTAHGSDLHRDQHMLLEKVDAAAGVITISEDNRRMILDLCGDQYSDKVHVVHCGVDLSEFANHPARGTDDRPDEPFRIICIGTLHEVKGQRYLIEACHYLHQQGRKVECHFVGDGPDDTLLQQLTEGSGLSDTITFHGRKTGPEIRDLLRTSDALVTPSVPTKCGRREGIPVVLMEAMASGLPVIASDLSGIPELVQHEQTGLLTPIRDAVAIAAAIHRLMTNQPLRERLADAGRAKVEADFNLATNTSRLHQLFEQMGAN